MSANEFKMFLENLKILLVEEGTEWHQNWKGVPTVYKKDFKSWVGEYKQQTWNHPGGWERAWDMYHLEYIVFLVDQQIGVMK